MLRWENLWVADGTGKEPFRAAVLTDGGTIAAMRTGVFSLGM